MPSPSLTEERAGNCVRKADLTKSKERFSSLILYKQCILNFDQKQKNFIESQTMKILLPFLLMILPLMSFGMDAEEKGTDRMSTSHHLYEKVDEIIETSPPLLHKLQKEVKIETRQKPTLAESFEFMQLISRPGMTLSTIKKFWGK